jgi:glutamate-1-semialdehyde 2,1-aminomutase
LYGITPDLTCLGKIIGGGLPVGAYGGKREIMSMIAPAGPVYQAGTLSGNPLAITAGIETLKVLSQPGVYEQLDKSTALLEAGIRKAIDSLNLKIQVSRLASLLTIFFTDAPLVDYDSVATADTAMFAKFHQQLLRSGIYWAPSQFEAAFISLAHSDADIQTTIDKISEALSYIMR